MDACVQNVIVTSVPHTTITFSKYTVQFDESKDVEDVDADRIRLIVPPAPEYADEEEEEEEASKGEEGGEVDIDAKAGTANAEKEVSYDF
jgi:hypothetical protein